MGPGQLDNNSHRTVVIVIILPDTVNTGDQFNTKGVIFPSNHDTLYILMFIFCLFCRFFFFAVVVVI